MDEIDREVLATIAGDVLSPVVAKEVMSAAQELFEANSGTDTRASWQSELQRIEREQTRLTDAVASGADAPVLIARLRETERQRRELVAQMQATTRPRVAWREIERRAQRRLADWRSLFSGGVADAREGFRQLLSAPILFTPFVEKGYRAIRFELRIGDNLFGSELVTNVASPRGIAIRWNADFLGLPPDSALGVSDHG